MIYSDDNYELANELEVDSLLADLPFDLLKENLREQINDPLSTNIDYIDIILDKTRVLKDQFGDNEDMMQQIATSLSDFFRFIINEIDDKFGLSMDIETEDVDQLVLIGSTLYNFLILRYKKNIGRFIYKFIIKNKKSLVEQFDKLAKKKDVTSISLKKQLKNKDDILILSNLPNVIKYIMNLYIEPLDFLRYSCDDEYYEGTVVKQMILSGRLIGNFVTEYLKLIVDEYDDVLDEIQTDVRLKLMKKIM